MVRRKVLQEFLQTIYNTPERPDIVVWSEKANEVVLIELTVGDESNFSDQEVRKEARYNKELIPLYQALLPEDGKLSSLQ